MLSIARILRHIQCSFEFQQKFTQPAFIITSISLVYYGETSVLPLLYMGQEKRGCLLKLQWFGYFIALQVLVNWLCVKLVVSKYDPSIHGAEEPNYNKRFPSKSVGDQSPNLAMEENLPQRIVTSYFAWSFCIRCDKPRPPRCHHCPICQMCVLKRDHHCFLTNVCIGYRNLRHFIVFLFWTVIGALFCLSHMTVYYFYYAIPKVPLLHTNPFTREYSTSNILLDIEWIFFSVLFISTIFFSSWSVFYFQEVAKLIVQGQTTFEFDAGLNLRDGRDLNNKMKSVFGHYWIFNVFVPLHFVFEPIDDPAYWPHLKYV